MTNHISFLTHLKDANLRLDEQVPQPLEDSETCKIIHLVQSYPQRCPICHRWMIKNGTRTVKYTALKVAGVPVKLYIRKQKYLCKPDQLCPRMVTRFARVKGICPYHRIIEAVKQALRLDLEKNESQKDLAADYNVSPATVNQLLKQISREEAPVYDWLPSAIALDDFKVGKQVPSEMGMVLMNISNHRLMDVIESRRNCDLRHYFYHYDYRERTHVRLVVLDLYQPYRRLVHQLFPQAIIVADHFHVVAQAYRALNQVRIQTMNRCGQGTHEYRALKSNWKLLLKSVAELDYQHFWRRRSFRWAQLSETEMVQRLLGQSSELQAGYTYYQQLITSVRKRDGQALAQLLKKPWTQLPGLFQKVQRTLRLHHQEIVNSFAYPYSNGPVEGVNNKIKVIKRTAYGLRNFSHFRTRILLAIKGSNLIMPKRKRRSAA